MLGPFRYKVTNRCVCMASCDKKCADFAAEPTVRVYWELRQWCFKSTKDCTCEPPSDNFSLPKEVFRLTTCLDCPAWSISSSSSPFYGYCYMYIGKVFILSSRLKKPSGFHERMYFKKKMFSSIVRKQLVWLALIIIYIYFY